MNDQHGKLTPKGAVRAYCKQCLGLMRWNGEAVDDCQGDRAANGPCPFHPYRMGRRPSVKVFRCFCLHCTGGDRAYVNDCPATSCPAYPYRFGKNPALTGKRKLTTSGFDALKDFRQKAVDDGKRGQISTITP